MHGFVEFPHLEAVTFSLTAQFQIFFSICFSLDTNISPGEHRGSYQKCKSLADFTGFVLVTI